MRARSQRFEDVVADAYAGLGSPVSMSFWRPQAVSGVTELPWGDARRRHGGRASVAEEKARGGRWRSRSPARPAKAHSASAGGAKNHCVVFTNLLIFGFG